MNSGLKLSQPVEWLEISGRNPGPSSGSDRNKINVSVRGPLYAASAVFVRDVSADGRWMIRASVEASMPLKKKWRETVDTTGDFSHASSFASHLEKIESKPSAILWQRADHGLAMTVEGAEGGISFDIASVPVASSADLLFVLQDVWRPSPRPRGLFAVAAKKLYAIRLEDNSSGQILGRIAEIEEPSRVADWSAAFRKSFEQKTFDFEFGWSETERRFTGLEVKVPVLGRVRAQFAYP